MRKRGQFYLIAAIIIISVLIGFVAISNYVQRRSFERTYDLADELRIESANVLDHGTYEELDEEEFEELIMNFIEQYKDHEENIYFIFGNEDKVTVVSYAVVAAEINITGKVTITSNDDDSIVVYEGKIIKVKIILGESTYEFNLKKGENFYFIIQATIEDEEYVTTN